MHAFDVPACRPVALLLLAAMLISGCAATNPPPPDIRVSSTLDSGGLDAHAIAFLTPLTPGGREEDRQSLALAFAAALSDSRPNVRVVGLAQTLGAVNRAGLTRDYQRMYDGFRATGVLDRQTLAKLRGITGARYFALIQLADFRQEFELRAAARDAGGARIRLFVQVWDSVDGTVAWEGLNEAVYAASENGRPVTFGSVVDRAARDLIGLLP